MTNSVGALRLAATVWPTSTLREMTTPSTGEQIVQRSRLTLGVCECRLFVQHGRFRLVQVGDGGVVVGLRDELAVEQFLGPPRVDLRQFQGGLGVGEVALDLQDVGLVGGGINLRDDLPVGDVRIPIRIQMGNDSRNLAADRHVGDRVQLARGRHRIGSESPRVDGRRLVAWILAVVVLYIPRASTQHRDDGD